MSDIFNQLIGLLVGILSSWAFWYWQINVKPKIEISPVVAYDPDDDKLSIMIINGSRRQAIDIQASVFIGEIHGKWYGTIYTPKLNRKYLFALGGRKRKYSFWELPTTSMFEAVGGKKVMNLLSQKNKERRMVFTLAATDAISSTKTVRRISYSLEDIKQGKFKSSRNFEIIPSPDKKARKPRRLTKQMTQTKRSS